MAPLCSHTHIVDRTTQLHAPHVRHSYLKRTHIRRSSQSKMFEPKTKERRRSSVNAIYSLDGTLYTIGNSFCLLVLIPLLHQIPSSIRYIGLTSCAKELLAVLSAGEAAPWCLSNLGLNRHELQGKWAIWATRQVKLWKV